MNNIFYCSECKRILGTIKESEEIAVRGEVELNIFCQHCSKANKITLYEYNKDRMKKRC